MVVWRVSNHATLDGTGGLLGSGRWHNRGRPVIYCAENPATALLETLVHLEVDEADLPTHYGLLMIQVPDDLTCGNLDASGLPAHWQRLTNITRAIGDHWLAANDEALLSVPSVLVPETRNFLINPCHPESNRIEIVKRIDHPLDQRPVS